MIEIKCVTQDKALLTDMVPFQGELKKRTDKDIEALAESLSTDGLLMPFALWRHEDKLYILDGHGRLQALVRLSLTDPTILQGEYPIILIEAETEDDARKALLQITSTYGKFNRNGILQFAAPIINYKAPILAKVNKVPVAYTPIEDEYVIVRIKVRKDLVKDLSKKLTDVNGVEVL